MHRHLPFSMVDQAVLSAFNLGVNLFLLAISTPEGFGQFAFVLATILIFTSLQSALVGMPIMVYVPARTGEGRDVLLASLWLVDVGLRFVAGVLALGLFAMADPSPMFLVAATLALVATMRRETARATLFATAGFSRCLAMDAVSVGITVVFALGLQFFIDPVIAVLGGMAVGSAVGVSLLARRPRFSGTTMRRTVDEYRQYWPEIRWSFVGAGTTELHGRSYVFALERLRGFDALGYVQAGRVLVGPAMLCADAWAAVARPVMARALAEHDLRAATAALRDGALIMTAILLAYSLALWIAWPYVEALIFRGRYPDIGFLVTCWMVYAGICVFHIVVSVFVQAARGFRGLAFTTIASTVTVLLLLGILFWPVPIYYAIFAVIAAQIVAFAWVCVLALRIVAAARNAALCNPRTA